MEVTFLFHLTVLPGAMKWKDLTILVLCPISTVTTGMPIIGVSSGTVSLRMNAESYERR